ncbi:MAG: hypothetical protein ACI9HH_005385, partial [Pseudomonadota bacterium]
MAAAEFGWPIPKSGWPIPELSPGLPVPDASFASASRLYSVDVRSVAALKARLNGPIDWKPA